MFLGIWGYIFGNLRGLYSYGLSNIERADALGAANPEKRAGRNPNRGSGLGNVNDKALELTF